MVRVIHLLMSASMTLYMILYMVNLINARSIRLRMILNLIYQMVRILSVLRFQLQMYIQDPHTEIVSRIEAVRSKDIEDLHVGIVTDIRDMLDKYNVFAKSFRMA